MNKETKKKTWNIVVLISMLAITVSVLLIVEEVSSSKDYCNSIDGVYKISNFRYTCDNEILVNTKDLGWLKQSEILDFKIK